MADSALAARPLLCVVHDDDEVRRLLVSDLEQRFGRDCEVNAYTHATGAREALRQFRDTGRRVAAVFSTSTDADGGEAFRSNVDIRVRTEG